MWQQNWRDELWSKLDQPWDIIIIGGGITGAGILREATRLGLKALLVEQRDFAWGTSSRSSKMVHGGLRYLKEGKVGLTMASVQERQQLLVEGPGLIDPLGFLLANYKGDRISRFIYQAGLTLYDLLAWQWPFGRKRPATTHQRYDPQAFRLLAPHLTPNHLQGGFSYGDAQTDDARLVLRILQESVAAGGFALNYATATHLLRDEHGRITGVHLRDNESERTAQVYGRVVINATGAWADRLRAQVRQKSSARPTAVRPLRGSHLIFPAWRLPVAQAVNFAHPLDGRPVFICPWEGVTLVGTTDVDHDRPLDEEPAISPDEVAYLMAALTAQGAPGLALTLDDVIATFAGVRPVIGSGKADPSEESRDHVVWMEDGLITVTGGKLTTFRLIALDVLKAARHALPELPPLDEDMPILNHVDEAILAQGGPQTAYLDQALRRRLVGRYGAAASQLIAEAQPGELTFIPGTPILWAELRWAAQAEGVVHLDDLLLRRVRLGLLAPEGGAAWLPHIRTICQPLLGWDDARWHAETTAYLALWRRCYALPDRATIPNWRHMLAKAARRHTTPLAWRHSPALPLLLTGLAFLFILFLAGRLTRRHT